MFARSKNPGIPEPIFRLESLLPPDRTFLTFGKRDCRPAMLLADFFFASAPAQRHIESTLDRIACVSLSFPATILREFHALRRIFPN